MTLEEWIDKLPQKINEAVMAEAAVVASEIRQSVPANRIKTRNAIRVRRTKTGATVGLKFAQEYPGTKTPTHRFLERQWSLRRPIARQRLIARINDAVNGT